MQSVRDNHGDVEWSDRDDPTKKDLRAQDCLNEPAGNKRSRTASLVGMLLSLSSSPKRKHQQEDSVSTYAETSVVSASSSSTTTTTDLTATRIPGSTRVVLHDNNASSIQNSRSDLSTIETPASEEKQDDEESCFICMGAFTRKNPKMQIPCMNRCNNSPVHGKCIYEWSESKQIVGTSSCPLCRGQLERVDFIPRDRIGSHRFSDFSIRRDFISRPIAQESGIVRCYVRAVRQGFHGACTRYELYLQAPTTLKYPLGPLPPVNGTKPGDILLAVSHKHVNRWGCPQLDITMDPAGLDFDTDKKNYLGCLYSSFTGLEHTLVVPHREHALGDRLSVCELGAIRYTQNRIGRAVGPRRIHVCFPRVVKCIGLEKTERVLELNNIVPFPSSPDSLVTEKTCSPSPSDIDDIIEVDFQPNGSLNHNLRNSISTASPSSSLAFSKALHPEEEEDEEEVDRAAVDSSWSTFPYRPQEKQRSLSAVLRAASQPDATKNTDDYLFGCNRSPYWLPAINAFSLDFGGRVTLPSNKNFQLIMNDNTDDVSLQFGKIAETDELEVFTLDVAWPLSPLQAFGVCLSACDRKLLCA